MHIASLLPSATEIVNALGLRERLVGVSHSCDWPPGVEDLPHLTSTAVPVDAGSREIDDHVRRRLAGEGALYALDLDALEAARPDIVVSQRLCDVCAVSMSEVENALCSLSSAPRLVDTEPSCLDDVFGDIRRVADAAGVPGQGEAVVAGLAARMRALKRRTAAIPAGARPRLAMIEWLDPPFNSGHWSPELVEAAGAVDVLGPPRKPSHTIDWDEVLASRPGIVLLSVCGFDIDRTLRELDAIGAEPGWRAVWKAVGGRVLVMDGNAHFSRPGPRLVEATETLAHALHPDIHPRFGHEPAPVRRLTRSPGPGFRPAPLA